MMYLLDTDTTIYSMKGIAAVKKNLLLRYNSPIKISIVTLMELCYGAYKSQNVSANLTKIRQLEQASSPGNKFPGYYVSSRWDLSSVP